MRWTPNRYRTVINWCYPPYFGTGVSIRSIAPDWQQMHIRMKLRWYNRNALGTHFGGSLYAMVDPHCVIMLMQQLGSAYVVWDQAAEIRFLKPGRGTVHCHVEMPSSLTESIRQQAESGQSVRPERLLNIIDEQGETVCEVRKQLYVRLKDRRTD